MTEQNIK